MKPNFVPGCGYRIHPGGRWAQPRTGCRHGEDLAHRCRNFREFGPGKGTARESGQRGKAVAGMVGLPAAAFWYITAIFRLICQCGIVATQGLFGALSGNCP